MDNTKRTVFIFSCLSLIAVSGCAFDVTHVKQISTNFVSSEPPAELWKLEKNVTVNIGTGYTRELKANTTWSHVGNIDQGKVYKTNDQILTVEASNIFEAYIVVSQSNLVGFYLPVEKTFSPLSSPVKLSIKPFGNN